MRPQCINENEHDHIQTTAHKRRGVEEGCRKVIHRFTEIITQEIYYN